MALPRHAHPHSVDAATPEHSSVTAVVTTTTSKALATSTAAGERASAESTAGVVSPTDVTSTVIG